MNAAGWPQSAEQLIGAGIANLELRGARVNRYSVQSHAGGSRYRGYQVYWTGLGRCDFDAHSAGAGTAADWIAGIVVNAVLRGDNQIPGDRAVELAKAAAGRRIIRAGRRRPVRAHPKVGSVERSGDANPKDRLTKHSRSR